MASSRADARLKGRLVCSKCHREFDRSHILWCERCNQDLLCSGCGDQHVEETDHDVGGLCNLHDKMLLRYCKSCKRVICNVCEAALHSSQGHDVVDYRDIIKQCLNDLESHIDETGKTTFSALIGQIDEIVDLQEETIEKKDHLRGVINDVYGCNSTSEAIDVDIAKMKDGIKYHQEEIEKLKKDIQDAEQKKKRCEIWFQKKKMLLDQLAVDFDSKLSGIETARHEAEEIRDQLRGLLGRGTLLSKEKLLPPRFLGDIERTTTEISDLGAHAGMDRVKSLKEMTKKTSAFGLSEDYIRSGGVRSGASSRERILLDFNVLGITFITQYQVAICGCSKLSLEGNCLIPPFKVILFDIELSEVTVLMSVKNPLVDVNKLNENELVVLGRADPLLHIVDISTKNIRCIKVNLSKKAMESMRQVEVTKQGRFVVIYGWESNARMVLIDDDGVVLHDIDINGNYLTICSLTNTIFTCSYANNICTQYNLGDNSITKVQSLPHRSGGFSCYDICSGSLGEVFVIGKMRKDSKTMHIYQAVLGEDGKITGGMKRIPMSDSTCIRMGASRFTLAINHNNIVIGHGIEVCLYKLE